MPSRPCPTPGCHGRQTLEPADPETGVPFAIWGCELCNEVERDLDGLDDEMVEMDEDEQATPAGWPKGAERGE